MDKDVFFRRIKRLYSAWSEAAEDDPLSEIDALVAAYEFDEDAEISRKTTLDLQIWLFGYEWSKTVLVLCENTIHILASRSRIAVLEELVSDKGADRGAPQIVLLTRNRGDRDQTNFKKLRKAIRGSKKGQNVGVLSEDVPSGDFIQSWRLPLPRKGFTEVDVRKSVALVMAWKEDCEIKTMREASSVTCDIFIKYLRKEIMDIINTDREVRHWELAGDVEDALHCGEYVSGLRPSHLEVCYPPIIQSGKGYDLKFSKSSDGRHLDCSGTIICGIGVRYNFYCSSIVRTLMVEPTEEILENYEFLLDVEEEIFNKLQDGVELRTVNDHAVEFVRQHRPELEEKMVIIGFATGIRFKERTLRIRSTAEAKEGMTFIIHVGFTDLCDEGGMPYALCIGDTVLVNKGSAATVLTEHESRVKLACIYYDDEEEVKFEIRHGDREKGGWTEEEVAQWILQLDTPLWQQGHESLQRRRANSVHYLCHKAEMSSNSGPPSPKRSKSHDPQITEEAEEQWRERREKSVENKQMSILQDNQTVVLWNHANKPATFRRNKVRAENPFYRVISLGNLSEITEENLPYSLPEKIQQSALYRIICYLLKENLENLHYNDDNGWMLAKPGVKRSIEEVRAALSLDEPSTDSVSMKMINRQMNFAEGFSAGMYSQPGQRCLEDLLRLVKYVVESMENNILINGNFICIDGNSRSVDGTTSSVDGNSIGVDGNSLTHTGNYRLLVTDFKEEGFQWMTEPESIVKDKLSELQTITISNPCYSSVNSPDARCCVSDYLGNHKFVITGEVRTAFTNVFDAKMMEQCWKKMLVGLINNDVTYGVLFTDFYALLIQIKLDNERKVVETSKKMFDFFQSGRPFMYESFVMLFKCLVRVLLHYTS